jgi:hypothetical protein
MWRETVVKLDNHFLLPRSMRGLLVGKSGSGKTNLLMFLLLKPGVLDYNNLIVRGRSLHQKEYVVLRAALTKGLDKSQIGVLFQSQHEIEQQGGIENALMHYHGECPRTIQFSFDSDIENIPDPSRIDPRRHNLLILDDVMLQKQGTAEAFFTRGRHNNIQVLYITQSYFRLPRQTIRENSNIFFLFQQDNKNLVHIYQDLAAMDGIDFQAFQRFCNNVWATKYAFVTIDLTRTKNLGKYRRNLQDFWIPPLDAYKNVTEDGHGQCHEQVL